MPLSPINMKSPYELIFKEKPSVKHLRVFGSICYVHVPESQRTKHDAKARKCIFVGYDERKKGWKCMDPKTHLSIVSRDVVFDEISLYYEGMVTDQKGVKNSTPNIMEFDITDNLSEKQGERGSSSTQHSELQRPEESTDATRSERPQRTIVKPAHYRDENFISTYFFFLFAGPIDDEEPHTFEEAKGNKEWELAMDDEMKALEKNQTWSLVPKPKDIQPVSCKWVYKIKSKVDGSVERYKARLVARGFS